MRDRPCRLGLDARHYWCGPCERSGRHGANARTRPSSVCTGACASRARGVRRCHTGLVQRRRCCCQTRTGSPEGDGRPLDAQLAALREAWKTVDHIALRLGSESDRAREAKLIVKCLQDALLAVETWPPEFSAEDVEYHSDQPPDRREDERLDLLDEYEGESLAEARTNHAAALIAVERFASAANVLLGRCASWRPATLVRRASETCAPAPRSAAGVGKGAACNRTPRTLLEEERRRTEAAGDAST